MKNCEMQPNKTAIVDGIPVNVYGGEMADSEIFEYIAHGIEKHGKIESADIVIDSDYVELSFKLPVIGFDRIRRITGYLVGTLDRFNDGKRAEVNDRVKHCCS